MTNGSVRVTENSSREVILEWTPPRYHEEDQVQFHVECFKGSQKVKEVFQSNSRIEFANLEPNTQYRFQVTPVIGKDRKQHGHLVYANIKTRAIVKGIIEYFSFKKPEIILLFLFCIIVNVSM